jgi:TPR repeat protein
MLTLYKVVPLFFLLNLTFNNVAFARTQYTAGYEAAQSGNYKRAVSIWTPLAEQGDPSAQYTLGWMFESGQGVKQDNRAAAFWYTKAAEQGDVAAQYVLATMYQKGTGVAQDNKKAVEWLTKAASQGDAVAQFQLGIHYRKGLGVNQDDQQSLQWFEKAAQQGHITSQINLGTIYQSGRGTEINYELAIKWYETAANQNNALGQYHLAHMHEYGRGVTKNLKTAKSLYLQSANNEYAPSAYKLAEFYELGKGTDIDFKNAAKWYKKSAFKGNSAAQFKLGNLHREGKGVKKDIRSAIEWYNLAANQDHAQAHYHLGLLYEKGVENTHKAKSIKINYKKALHHYQSASQLDDPFAHVRLAYLYEKGLGTEVNLRRAVQLYQKSTQPIALERYELLNKELNCYETATTKLFTINIACTKRDVLRKKIKEEKIVAISENDTDWSDNYFTGAVIRGSSELQVTYTREDYFVSAKYTFVGRKNPQLIGKVKSKLVERYGQPAKKSGIESEGPVSYEWFLDDGIHLSVARGWPDTTTYVLYLSPEKKRLLEAQQKQSSSKTFSPYDQPQDNIIDSNLF